MLFDTHCHLNFGSFDGKVDKVIDEAKKAGVNRIVIPGTDVPTSKKAVKIAEEFDGIYAAVGIHPHHIMQYQISNIKYQNDISNIKQDVIPAKAGIHFDLMQIEKLLQRPKVVAIGEVGIDRHIYQKTKYPDYKIEGEFIELQKIILQEQIGLAIEYDKSLVLHNREAKNDMIKVLNNNWNKKLEGRSVFHCCEPDLELLEYAKNHKMFIGVDGDITYYKEKQEFIKNIPLEMLVLETDSPFLNPRLRQDFGGQAEPLKSKYNEPRNIPLIAEFIANLKNISVEKLSKQTTENARKLFRL